MGDLRVGLFRQMEGTHRWSPRRGFAPELPRGDRFEVQEQAMINLGVPEAVAGNGAKAFILFAGGDAGYVGDGVPLILGRLARSLEQLPPIVPRRSPDARARSRPRSGLPP